jgi:predicted GNAT family acetyltransferase
VTGSDLDVRDAPEQSRYEARIGDRVAGFSVYVRGNLSGYGREEPLFVFVHTEVDPAFEGQGVGGGLVRGALDDLRRRGALVMAQCPFVHAWLERHAEYGDLVFDPPPSRVPD